MTYESLSISSSSRRLQSEAKHLRLIPKHQSKFGNKLVLPTSQGVLLIDFNKIEYCRADGNYTNIHLTNGGKILCSKCLKKLYEMLPSTHFIRVHQSYVVPSGKIELIKNAEVVMESGIIVPMSRKYRLILLQDLRADAPRR